MSVVATLHQAEKLDAAITCSWRWTGIVAGLYLQGRISWEDAQRKWAYHAAVRRYLWQERRGLP